MGSIPGPIINFRWNVGEINGAIDNAGKRISNQLNKAGKSSAQSFAADWEVAAAKLRASLSTEKLGIKQIADARKGIVSQLEKEISLQRQKLDLENLTARQQRTALSGMKAATIELERQKNALAGRAALSAPTQAFLDAIKLRVGSGGFGGGGFGGMLALRAYEPVGKSVEAMAGKMEERLGGAAIAVGGLTIGLVALGAAAVGVTKGMMDLAQGIQNASAATGLSITQVQTYNELAKEMNLDADTLQMAFARMQSQLGEFAVKGKSAGTGSQYFVQVLQSMGVQLKTTSGTMRPMNDIVSDFADKLGNVSDAATRNDIALAAFGTRGRIVVQMMQQATNEGKSLKQILDDIGGSSIILGDAQVTQLTRAKAAWDEFGRGIGGAFLQLKDLVAFATIHPLTALGAYASGGAGGLAVAMNMPVTSKQLSAFDVLHMVSQGATAQLVGEQNQRSLTGAQILSAGGKDQFALLEAQKNYSEAIKNNQGALAMYYARQVASLEKIVALEAKRLYGPGLAMLRRYRGGTQGIAGPTLREAGRLPMPLTPEQALLQQYLGISPFAVPNIPGVGPLGAGLGVGSSISSLTGGGPSSNTMVAQSMQIMEKLHDEWINSTADAVTKIKYEYQKELANYVQLADEKKITAQQLHDAEVELQAIAAKKIEKIQEQTLSKYKNDWGGVFDAIVSGQKNIGQTIGKMLENAALSPIKTAFENMMARAMQGVFGNGQSGANGSHGVAGGIFGSVGGFWGKIVSALGIGTNASLAVQTQNVNAGVVNISGSVGTGGTGGGLGFLGGISSFSSSTGIGGLSLALAGDGGTAVAGSGGAAVAGGGSTALSGSPAGLFGSYPGNTSPNVLGAAAKIVGSAIPGGVILGQGLHDSNGAAIAMGAGAMGQGVLKSISAMTGGNNTNIGKALGTAANIVGGIGQIVAGSQTGGVGGALQGAMGGAETGSAIGTMILPGLGTAIGAGLGAIVGGLTSAIFGGGSAKMHAQHWQTAITHAAALQQIIAPPSESFNFAAGNNMSSTFANTFSEGPNGTFGTVGLPFNTPFSASSIIGYPKTGGELTAMQLALSRVNTGLPFFGAPTSGLGSAGIFQGQNLPPGTHSSGTTEVHFHLPGFIDQNSADAFVEKVAPKIHAIMGKSINVASSGMKQAIFRANNMP